MPSTWVLYQFILISLVSRLPSNNPSFLVAVREFQRREPRVPGEAAGRRVVLSRIPESTRVVATPDSETGNVEPEGRTF